MNAMTVGSVVAAAALAAGCAGTVTTGAQPVAEIARGQFGQLTERRFELLTDEASYNSLWRLHIDGDPPPVDFDEHSVIAVLLGERRTGGHGIVVAAVDRENGVLQVEVVTTGPGRGCRTSQAFTQPYQFVTVPAGAGEAEFTTRHTSEPCE